ncbi:DUF2252 domain-containing protein [soil metagenome]
MAPTDDIARSAADRQSTLTRTRRLKMARSAHAYVRGSTQQFYQWLESTPATVPDGPAIWICGDCHLGNLGPLADRKGLVAIQIRDLDQTVIGNPAHDIIRLGLSLASALRGSDLPGVTTARMLEALIAGYQAALDPEASKADPTDDHPRLVQRLLTRSVRRRWPQLAEERLKGDKARIALGKRFWPLEREERAALADLLQGADVRDLLTRDTRGAVGDRIKLIDAAYWMKGCSSLGRLRYAALVKVGSGKTATTGLIDIKAAVAAAAPRAIDAVMPRDNGERVLAGARALSPNLGDRMAAGRLDGQAVTLRELAPQDLKIELSRTRPAEAVALGRYLGGVVGEAHGRQMTEADRMRWNMTLTRSRSAILDAPSWLWSSVVELIGLHEAAYLEHCRQYALLEAA